jgi:hypothetical protein
MPENADAWELWRAVCTQWRAGGMGIIGLDYGVAMEMADRMGIEWSPAVMIKIQALERATLKGAASDPAGS